MAKSKLIIIWSVISVAFFILWVLVLYKARPPEIKTHDVKITEIKKEESGNSSYIKWAEFKPTFEMLKKASEIDIKTKGEISWIDLLAYSVSKTYGSINENSLKFIDECAEKTEKGEDISDGLKYFDFYKEVYTAVLGNFIGPKGKDYGLIAYSPIAEGFYYNHYNDFGSARSYGFQRTHKGNDLIGSVGTPVVSVEGGYVEAIGWNVYGGWRVGIRSYDKKRYYYYAHLRKDFPFRPDLKQGDEVYAGQVIGYLGRSGYSTKENINNIETPHLHFGMQLIFDESQKDSVSEIWIDVYNIVKFLYENRSEVIYNEESKVYIEKN